MDSASPQNERTIVEEFQQRYANIVYIRTEQRETVYGAWNRAIRASRGKYLTSANTDDRHRPDALEVLARTLERQPEIALVYADCLITRTENETFETAHPVNTYRWLDFNPEDLLLKGCFVGPQPMWRRELHDEFGYFDAGFTSAGDYEFWLRLAAKRKFLHVKETLGLYLESPTSVEHTNQERAAREVAEARARHGAALLPATEPVVAPAPTRVAGQGTAPGPKPKAREAKITLPPSALVGHLGPARELRDRKRYPEAWENVLGCLGARPFHPEAFLLLAEIALAAGDGPAARRCAQHAADLAPKWQPARQFLKGELSGKAHPDWLVLPAAVEHPQVNDAGRLTVCLMVKNEEKFLDRCLASVRGLASQIVLVDTGSTDRTLEIAREHGAEIYHAPGTTTSAGRAMSAWNMSPAIGCWCWTRTRNCPRRARGHSKNSCARGRPSAGDCPSSRWAARTRDAAVMCRVCSGMPRGFFPRARS